MSCLKQGRRSKVAGVGGRKRITAPAQQYTERPITLVSRTLGWRLDMTSGRDVAFRWRYRFQSSRGVG